MSRSSKWLVNIGLEIHAQILSQSKLFSGASVEFGAVPNSHVSYFDAALPGTLPSLNRRCAELGVKASLALNCRLNYKSRFDRKHYFYADLPAGYQITQFSSPLARSGHLEYVVAGVDVPKAYFKRSSILQVQLEQDSGRSFHDPQTMRSLIDLNRAGVGLLEIITEPNIESGREASALVKELSALLLSLEICSGQMEKGHMRVDANVSIRKANEDLGIRSEVKNINSFNHIKNAIDFEIRRHIELKERGEDIINETRMFDLKSGLTFPMRDKEMLQDYRFLPEPNLPPLILFDLLNPIPPNVQKERCINVDEICKTLRNDISSKREFLLAEYKLSLDHVAYIMDNDSFNNFFESCMQHCPPEAATVVCNVSREFEKFLAVKLEKGLAESPVQPKELASLACLLHENIITSDTAYVALMKCCKSFDGSPGEYIRSNNLWAIRDTTEIDVVAKEIADTVPKLIVKAKAGGKNAQKNLRKVIRNKTVGRIEPEEIERFVLKLLKN